MPDITAVIDSSRPLSRRPALISLKLWSLPLRVVRFSGHEAISSLYEFRVEVAGADFDPETLLGQPVALAIGGFEAPRLVHGLVCEAEYIGHTRHLELYELIIAPWAHRLLHQSGCRIFQDKTTEQIVTDVLMRAGLRKDWFRFSLTETYAPRNYCVQYRENDFSFISRLLEEDGIFYFFEHEDDKHVWVMADHSQTLAPISGVPSLHFNPPLGTVQDREHIKAFRFGGRVRAGKVTLRDFNLHQPDLMMEVKDTARTGADQEVYDFPGEYQDPGRAGPHQGQSIAKIRLEELQATRRLGTGESDCPRLMPGKVMTLVGHPREELNREYRVTQVSHEGSQPQVLDQDAAGETTYKNSFTATELKVPFRPARVTPRPTMRGLQSATVVGPEGEEVHTDEHGRVRVQFHWDREGSHDEKSACWIRVSQVWAGNGWGAMFLPRIGHEVLVDFLEGDPDRPIITGRIYHGLNDTPYKLPDEKTKSTIKSDSSLGGGGYNELRYEDKKGAEQIYIHAERNMDVRVNNDAFSTVSNDAHVTVGHEEKGKGGDSFVQLFHDHHLKIHQHTKAHLGGDVEVLVGGIDAPGRVDLHIRSDKLELVDGDRHEHVRKSSLEKIDGSVSRLVGGDEQAKIGGRLAVEARDEVHVKASKIVLDASDGLTIQGPGGFITINSSGIFIRGNMVFINSAGSPIAARDAQPTTAQDARDANPTPATPSERGSK